MKKFIFTMVIPMAIAVFILPGCTKLVDYLEHHGSPPQLCDIQKIISPGIFEGPVPDTLYFSYNRDGSPASAIRNGFADEANPNWFFSYDRQGRLIQAAALFSGFTISNGKLTGSGIYLHRYSYDIRNRVSTDTFKAGPTFVNGVLTVFHGEIQVSHLEYDSRDRIIKETITEISQSGGPATPNGSVDYNYDANGNLTKPGQTIVYDQKVNFYRTNKVWMLINRNYSVNNPFTAGTYNSFGLPTKDIPPFAFLFLGYSDATIQYSCQ
jgi:hypothetical protein